MSNSCGFCFDDLKKMMTIIEKCQERGTFHADEMTDIGSLYDKLKRANDAHSTLDKSVNTDDECVNTCNINTCNISNVGT